MHRPGRLGAVAAAAIAAVLTACGGRTQEQSLQAARQQIDKREFNAATIELKSVLQQSPSSGEARYLLGKTLFESGDAAAAEVEFRKAIESTYRSDALVAALAKAMLARGKHAKLIEEFGNTKTTDPAASADLHTSLAEAYLRTGGRERAETLLAEVLQAQPDFAAARLLRARIVASQGESGVDAALQELKAGGPALARSADAAYLEGKLLLDGKRDVDAATKAFEQALVLRPDYLPAHEALIALQLYRRDTAAATRQAAAMKLAAPQSAQARLFELQMAYLNGQYPQARELAQQLLRFMPDNLRLLYIAGAVEFELNALVQAETHLNKAVTLAPKFMPPRKMLARTYLRSGQPAKALSVLAPMLDAQAPAADTLVLAAEAHLQSGDTKASEAFFKRANQAKPNDTQIRTALALNELSKGHDDAAFGELRSLASTSTGSVTDLALISAHTQRGQWDQALEAIAVLEKKQPDKPLPPHLRGRVLLLRQDLAGAKKSFDLALTKDAVYFPSIASLASIDLLERKPELAQKRLEAVITVQPRNVQALLALAELKAKTSGSKPAEVTALIDQAIKASPGETGPRAALVNYLLASGQAKPGLDAAQAGLAASPNSPDMLLLLGNAQLASGEPNQAITSYNKLVKMQPNAAQPHLGLAAAYKAAKNTESAISSLQQALAITPDLLPAQRELITMELIAKRPERAIEVARTVQKQRPQDAVGFMLAGDVEAQRKNWDAAALAFRLGLDKKDLRELPSRLHYALLAGNKAADANRFEQDWLKKHPSDAGFLFYLGDLSLSARDWVSAEKRYRQVLSIDADNAAATNNVAWLMALSKTPGAVAMGERAVALAPNSAPAFDTLASTLAADKQWARALEAANKALSLASDTAPYRLQLAKVLLDSGDKAKAKTELDRLTQLGNKFNRQSEVTALLGRL